MIYCLFLVSTCVFAEVIRRLLPAGWQPVFVDLWPLCYQLVEADSLGARYQAVGDGSAPGENICREMNAKKNIINVNVGCGSSSGEMPNGNTWIAGWGRKAPVSG